MHLKPSGFTYSACWPFTESKESIQKFKETKDLQYIYQNKLVSKFLLAGDKFMPECI